MISTIIINTRMSVFTSLNHTVWCLKVVSMYLLWRRLSLLMLVYKASYFYIIHATCFTTDPKLECLFAFNLSTFELFDLTLPNAKMMIVKHVCVCGDICAFSWNRVEERWQKSGYGFTSSWCVQLEEDSFVL